MSKGKKYVEYLKRTLRCKNCKFCNVIDSVVRCAKKDVATELEDHICDSFENKDVKKEWEIEGYPTLGASWRKNDK